MDLILLIASFLLEYSYGLLLYVEPPFAENDAKYFFIFKLPFLKFNIFRFLYLFAKVVKNIGTTKYIMIKNVNAIKIISGSRIKSITTYRYLYRSLQRSRRSLFQCHYFSRVTGSFSWFPILYFIHFNEVYRTNYSNGCRYRCLR